MSVNKSPITDDQFNEILTTTETTTLSVKSICEQMGISRQCFYNYLRLNGEKARDKYARSKYMQAELIADEIVDIADDGSNDLMTVVKGDFEYETERKEVINRSRLRIDSRKWLLSKLIPKKYGDKLDITSDGEKIINKIEVEFIQPPTKTNDNKNIQ